MGKPPRPPKTLILPLSQPLLGIPLKMGFKPLNFAQSLTPRIFYLEILGSSPKPSLPPPRLIPCEGNSNPPFRGHPNGVIDFLFNKLV